MKLKLLILFTGIGIFGHAQIPTFNPFFFADNSAKSTVTPVDLIAIGKYHLDTKWNAGTIHLKNGDSLVAYYMRYDLVKNQLEIILNNKIKAINGGFIDRFEWFSVDRLRPEQFVSKQHFQFENQSEVTGFIELIQDGTSKLLKSTRVFAPIEATSPTLVNDTDQDIQILEEYFIVLGNEANEISGGKRKNLELFNSAVMDKYVKQNNLKFNNPGDLKEIVEYYNSLNK